MKVGLFMAVKHSPVFSDTTRGGRGSGGRPSRLGRMFQLSSPANLDPYGPTRGTRRRVRKSERIRLLRHRAVKRASFGDSPRLPGDLEEQLLDLPVAADEFGIPVPSASLFEKVRRILWDLRYETTGRCLVYLMPDGAVAVDVRGKRPDGIFITIRDDGTVRCSGEIRGKVWRKLYPSSGDIPDDDLLDELFKLRSGALEE